MPLTQKEKDAQHRYYYSPKGQINEARKNEKRRNQTKYKKVLRELLLINTPLKTS